MPDTTVSCKQLPVGTEDINPLSPRRLTAEEAQGRTERSREEDGRVWRDSSLAVRQRLAGEEHRHGGVPLEATLHARWSRLSFFLSASHLTSF